MEKYYVYVYLDPRKAGNYVYNQYCFNHEPFYVGKGSGNRLNVHLKRNGSNKHLTNKILNIRSSNLEPIVLKVKSNLLEEESYLFEEELITVIGRRIISCGPLVNIKKGGPGKIGVSDEAKEKISAANKGRTFSDEYKKIKSIKNSGCGNCMYGKKHTIESKEKMSISSKGKKHTEETKEKMSISRKGQRRHTQKQIQAIKEYMSNRVVSDKTRKKMSEAHTDKKLSKETREKMALTRRTGLKRGEYIKSGKPRKKYLTDIEITTNNEKKFFTKIIEAILFIKNLKLNHYKLFSNKQIETDILNNISNEYIKIKCYRKIVCT